MTLRKENQEENKITLNPTEKHGSGLTWPDFDLLSDVCDPRTNRARPQAAQREMDLNVENLLDSNPPARNQSRHKMEPRAPPTGLWTQFI